MATNLMLRFFMACIVVGLLGCTMRQTIGYSLWERDQSRIVFDDSACIDSLNDVRAKSDDQFAKPKCFSDSSGSWCVNSEKGYGDVAGEVSYVILKHLQRRGPFVSVRLGKCSNQSLVISGSLKRFSAKVPTFKVPIYRAFDPIVSGIIPQGTLCSYSVVISDLVIEDRKSERISHLGNIVDSGVGNFNYGFPYAVANEVLSRVIESLNDSLWAFEMNRHR